MESLSRTRPPQKVGRCLHPTGVGSNYAFDLTSADDRILSPATPCSVHFFSLSLFSSIFLLVEWLFSRATIATLEIARKKPNLYRFALTA